MLEPGLGALRERSMGRLGERGPGDRVGEYPFSSYHPLALRARGPRTPLRRGILPTMGPGVASYSLWETYLTHALAPRPLWLARGGLSIVA